jgi:hypothetical protein
MKILVFLLASVSLAADWTFYGVSTDTNASAVVSSNILIISAAPAAVQAQLKVFGSNHTTSQVLPMRPTFTFVPMPPAPVLKGRLK